MQEREGERQPQGARDSTPRMRVAATRSTTTAEQWRAALERAGIDALVEIDDDRNAMPGQNPLLGVAITATGFVYAVSVPTADAERARRILAAAGRQPGGSGHDAHTGRIDRQSLRGALIVVAITAVLITVLAARL